MRYAIVDDANGVIASVIDVADDEHLALNTPDGATAIAFPYGAFDGAAYRYDWSASAFVSVPASQEAAPPVRYTFNAWVDLFSTTEQLAIVTATMSDPMAKLIYDRAQSASGSIDPADTRTLEGLRYLVSKGWVSQATYDRIAAL